MFFKGSLLSWFVQLGYFAEMSRRLSHLTLEIFVTCCKQSWNRSRSGPDGSKQSLRSSPRPAAIFLGSWYQSVALNWLETTAGNVWQLGHCDVSLFFQEPVHDSMMKIFRHGSGSVLMNASIERQGFKEGKKMYCFFGCFLVNYCSNGNFNVCFSTTATTADGSFLC